MCVDPPQHLHGQHNAVWRCAVHLGLLVLCKQQMTVPRHPVHSTGIQHETQALYVRHRQLAVMFANEHCTIDRAYKMNATEFRTHKWLCVLPCLSYKLPHVPLSKCFCGKQLCILIAQLLMQVLQDTLAQQTKSRYDAPAHPQKGVLFHFPACLELYLLGLS